jgi:hypothetical protein
MTLTYKVFQRRPDDQDTGTDEARAYYAAYDEANRVRAVAIARVNEASRVMQAASEEWDAAHKASQKGARS